MRFAIDRYAVGSEKEVAADDFDGQWYIPNRRNRFFCPECGEIVYFRAKGGAQPNHFFHQERTEHTPECEKRVDGHYSQSVTERLGFPLYLTCNSSGMFRLNIGFPALGDDLLQQVAKANYKVEIVYGDQKRSIQVNANNFYSDSITLVPVNFVPSSRRKYSVNIKGTQIVWGLRKWADYAEGFDINGAVFTYDETGGKKVRRGDSISINKLYYLVTKCSESFYPQIKLSKLGTLELCHEEYNIFKMKVLVSIDDEYTFSSVRDYLYRYYGVWLLASTPDIVPLWPPLVQKESFIPIVPNSKVTYAISSPNERPNVFLYSDYGVSRKNISHVINGISIFELTVRSHPVTLSVDRKYSGRETTYISKPLHRINLDYQVGIKDNSRILSLSEVDKELLSLGCSFLSSSKMELYVGSKDKVFQHFQISNPETTIKASADVSELFLTVASGIIHHISYEADTCDNEDLLDNIILRIKSSRYGSMVQIPVWADYTIRSLKSRNQLEIYSTIMSTISNGKIPTHTLEVIRFLQISGI